MTDPAIQVAAIRLVHPYEQFRAFPYYCGAWSIGYGSTTDALGKPVTSATPEITMREGLALAQRDMQAALATVDRLVTVPLNVNQTAALIDFVYNIGSGNFEGSTLLRLLNQGDYAGAGQQFKRWDMSDGAVLAGLQVRRAAEATLFEEAA